MRMRPPEISCEEGENEIGSGLCPADGLVTCNGEQTKELAS
jgi:hypothetical protein